MTFVGAPGTVAGVATVPAELFDVPAELVAVTVKVSATPLVSGEITHEVAGAVTVHVEPAGEAVTVYDVGAPPEPVEGLTTIVALPFPGVTIGACGAVGARSVHCAVKVTLAASIV